MKKILDYLEQLDFSKNEAKIYLTLLESGPMTVSQLAQRIQFNRTATYPYISSLLEKGVIAEILQGPRKQLITTEPERLQYLIEKKQESINAIQTKFPDIITTIHTSFSKPKNEKKIETKYYKGIDNVREIYAEAFRGNEIRSFAKVTDNEPEKLSPDNTILFNQSFKKNKKLKMWEIIYDSPFSRRQAIKILSKNNDRYSYKFMPENLKLSSEDILMYDSKVAIINYRGNVSTIILQSPDFYNNLKELFDFIWKIVPEP